MNPGTRSVTPERRSGEGEQVGSILIIKPSSFGDVIHTLPVLPLLREAYPQATIRWLVNPEWQPLLAGHPDLDEAVIFPRRELRGFFGLGRKLDWIKGARAQWRSDLVLDFQGLLRSALIGRACNRGRLIGLADAREGACYLYDEAVLTTPSHPGGRPLHAVERYLRVTDALGLNGVPRWHLPAGQPPERFNLEEPFVLLHPFARGAGKSLRREEIELFCEQINAPVVLVGQTKDDPGNIDRLDHVENLLNHTTLPELIWLIRKAAFVVSVDSGPMHIAAALAKPMLAIHTWSDPLLVGPYHPQAWIWQEKRLMQIEDARRITSGVRPRTAPDIASIAAFVTEAM